MLKKILLLSLFIANYNLLAQISMPYNLDFENGYENSLVFGWTLGNNAKENGFFAYTSATNPFYNDFCATIINTKNEKLKDKVGSLYQEIDAQFYISKKIQFKAMIKAAEMIEDALSGLNQNNDNNKYIMTTPPRIFINARDINGKLVAQTQSDEIYLKGWNEVAITLDIPINTWTITYGVSFTDTNDIYMDYCSIEIISDDSLYYEAPKQLSNLELMYLVPFANISGGVQYFHPSKIASETNWDDILLAGINQAKEIEALNSQSVNAIINDSLQEFFKQLAPEIVFSNSQINTSLFNQEKHKHLFAWLHAGVPSNIKSNELSDSRIVDLNGAIKYKSGVAVQYINLKKAQDKDLVITLKSMLEKFQKGAFALVSLRFENEMGNFISFLLSDTIRTDEWKEIVLKGKVPKDATKGLIILEFMGYGRAYFDEVKAMYNVIDKKNKTNEINYIDLNNAGFEYQRNFDLDNWQTTHETYEAGYQLGYSTEIKSAGKQSLSIFTDFTATPQFLPTDSAWYTTLSNDALSNNEDIEYIPIYVAYPLYVPAEFFENKTTDIEGKEIVNVEYETYPISNGFHSKTGKNENFMLSYKDRNSRLAMIIKMYNILKHFSLTEIDYNILDSLFIVSLKKAAVSDSKNDFNNILQDFINITDDNRARVWFNNDDTKNYSIPVNFELCGDELLISQIMNSTIKNIKTGDKILEIAGVDVNNITKNNSPQWKKEKEITLLKLGQKNTETQLKIKQQTEKIINEKVTKNIRTNNMQHRTINYSDVINDSIMYIDLTMYKDKELDVYFDTISQIKNFIFDLRGETLVSEYFLSLFAKQGFNTAISCLPFFTTPDKQYIKLQNISKYITPSEKKKIDSAKIIFLIDWKTMGDGELFAATAKNLKLGTLIGQNTQGTLIRGIANRLDADFSFSLGTMLGASPAGDILLNNPVQPDIIAEPTKENIGTDWILERAIKEFN